MALTSPDWRLRRSGIINLNYSDSVATPSIKGKTWCQNNDIRNCEDLGRLYTWAAAIDSVTLYNSKAGTCGYGMYGPRICELPTKVQGICPNGWRLPSKAEYETLIAVAGGTFIAGKNLKSQRGWDGKGEGADEIGFSALLAGKYFKGEFYKGACIWSATDDYTKGAYVIELNYSNFNEADIEGVDKSAGELVRCLLDENQ